MGHASTEAWPCLEPNPPCCFPVNGMVVQVQTSVILVISIKSAALTDSATAARPRLATPCAHSALGYSLVTAASRPRCALPSLFGWL